ncbi:MAG TPA: sodium:solute symporter [Ignavibacteriales bacterium]|nr:sodium:solute symporter [Ignavibacteriales bacterium]
MANFIDYAIIALFLIGAAAFGILKSGKQKTVNDYFLGAESVPWWAVCFSIVAAETSALTFISIPGLAYVANLNFLQVTLGYLIGRIIIAYFFLPSYYKGELNTAYAFLENRFGVKTRTFASIVFLFTRTAADGVRLFATAIPLKLMLGIDYPLAIIITAAFTLIYVFTGGVRGVIWVDVILMFVYVGGAIVAAIVLTGQLPDGINSIIQASAADNKLNVINWGFSGGISGFFSQPYTLIGGLVGGAFLSMASHGVDQLIVQRLLTIKNLRDGQKAIISSGVIVILQFALFLFVGLGLYAFYGQTNIRPDEIFTKFILEELPYGVKGFIIAGLFAAAMSTIAGSISAMSSSAMLDIYMPYFKKKNTSDASQLKISRIITLFWTVLLILAAFMFMESSQAVVEIALSIASFTYGGLLGAFMLGLFVKQAKQEDALGGFIAGLFIMISVISLKLAAFTWFTIIGVAAAMLVGSFLSSLSKKEQI